MAERDSFSFTHWVVLTLFGAVAALVLPLFPIAGIFFPLVGIPLVALRKLCGRSGLWSGALLIVSLMVLYNSGAAAALLLVLTFVVALYAELRLAHLPPSRAAVWSLFSASVAVTGGVFVWLSTFGWGPVEQLKKMVLEKGEEVAKMQPQLNLSVELLWRQLPAAIAIVIIAALAIGLTFESRVVNRLNHRVRDDETLRLYEFRNPDLLVWISIVAFLGTFLELGIPEIQTLSINVFYVLIFMYFLQGLAVVVTLFALMRVAAFWQWIWVGLFTLQLLPLVSLLGFSDYWLNFRERFIRKSSEGRKGQA